MEENLKQLLLKDLCARLPYGLIIHLVEPNEDEELYCLNIPQEGLYTRSLEHNNVTTLSPIEDIKPYLRPMSSMTEEERKEVGNLIKENRPDPYGIISNKGIDNLLFSVSITSGVLIDWLNAHHFDYRGLIPMGLALEAPEGMYK